MEKYSQCHGPKRVCIVCINALLLLILIIYYFAISANAFEVDHPSIEKTQAEALLKIADYIRPDRSGRYADLADRFLREHDYIPADESNWRAFPALRKIVTGYLAAYEANPDEGGELFLALLSHYLAREYVSIRGEPLLQPYLEKEVDVNTPIVFKLPSSPKIAYPLQPRMMRAISVLSKYCEGNALGGMYKILHHHLGIPEWQAFDILRLSNNNTEALQKAFALLLPEKRLGALERLVDATCEVYVSARFEESLKPFRTTELACIVVSNSPENEKETGVSFQTDPGSIVISTSNNIASMPTHFNLSIFNRLNRDLTTFLELHGSRPYGKLIMTPTYLKAFRYNIDGFETTSVKLKRIPILTLDLHSILSKSLDFIYVIPFDPANGWLFTPEKPWLAIPHVQDFPEKLNLVLPTDNGVSHTFRTSTKVREGQIYIGTYGYSLTHLNMWEIVNDRSSDPANGWLFTPEKPGLAIPHIQDSPEKLNSVLPTDKGISHTFRNSTKVHEGQIYVGTYDYYLTHPNMWGGVNNSSSLFFFSFEGQSTIPTVWQVELPVGITK